MEQGFQKGSLSLEVDPRYDHCRVRRPEEIVKYGISSEYESVAVEAPESRKEKRSR